MHVCNVCMCVYICNVRIYVYTSVYISLYVQYLYNSACRHSIFRTLIRRKRIVINTEVVAWWTVCTVGGFMFCGSQLDLWLTARTRSDCKNILSTTTVAFRQWREGLRKMNFICHGRWFASRQSKKAHSKLVRNVTTTPDTFCISAFLKLSLKEYV